MIGGMEITIDGVVLHPVMASWDSAAAKTLVHPRTVSGKPEGGRVVVEGFLTHGSAVSVNVTYEMLLPSLKHHNRRRAAKCRMRMLGKRKS